MSLKGAIDNQTYHKFRQIDQGMTCISLIVIQYSFLEINWVLSYDIGHVAFAKIK